jgi:hypothetical protein
VCENLGAANDWNFSANNWLPISGVYRHDPGVQYLGASYDQVDWDSIMLYPSGAGGIGDANPPASPGADPESYDRRHPVLLRNDGARIRANAVPSKGDVAGIKQLYESESYEKNAGQGLVLPNNKKSSRFTDFIKDFVAKKGKSCVFP